MAKRYIIRLNDKERLELKRLVSSGTHSAQIIKHANILLQADLLGLAKQDKEIAQMFQCHTNTVATIRQRFVEEGMASALQRKKRQTPPREAILHGEAEAQLIALACSAAPKGRSRWTLSLLADRLVELEVVETVSYETVRKTLKKMNLSHICAPVGSFQMHKAVHS